MAASCAGFTRLLEVLGAVPLSISSRIWVPTIVKYSLPESWCSESPSIGMAGLVRR